MGKIIKLPLKKTTYDEFSEIIESGLSSTGFSSELRLSIKEMTLDTLKQFNTIEGLSITLPSDTNQGDIDSLLAYIESLKKNNMLVLNELILCKVRALKLAEFAE